MPGPLSPAVGELTSIGFGKESVYATQVVSTTFHSVEDASPTPKNVLVERTGARKRRGQTPPMIAGFDGAASATVEADPDVFSQAIAFSLGAQTTPVAVGAVNTTITPAIASTGLQTVAVAAGTNIVRGGRYVVDTGGNQETITAQGISGTNLTAYFAKTHAAGVALTATADAGSYISMYTMGVLPSFTTELNRVTDTIDMIGCMVQSMQLTWGPNKGLTSRLSLVYANEVIQGSPVAPTYSTKSPFMFEHPGVINWIANVQRGAVGQVTVQSWEITLANNLAAVRSSGAGRQVVTWAQQQRKVTGRVILGFEADDLYQAFLGGTSPQYKVPGIAMSFFTPANDLAGTVYAYSNEYVLPNCTLETHAAAVRSTAQITQEFTFTAAESLAGANDDLTVYTIGSSSAVW